jgi:hypothetical protein
MIIRATIGIHVFSFHTDDSPQPPRVEKSGLFVATRFGIRVNRNIVQFCPICAIYQMSGLHYVGLIWATLHYSQILGHDDEPDRADTARTRLERVLSTPERFSAQYDDDERIDPNQRKGIDSLSASGFPTIAMTSSASTSDEETSTSSAVFLFRPQKYVGRSLSCNSVSIVVSYSISDYSALKKVSGTEYGPAGPYSVGSPG